MVEKKIVQVASGKISEPGPIRMTSDGKIGVDALNQLNGYIAELVKKINRGLSRGTGVNATLTGNLFGQFVEVTTPSVADTEFIVPHGLGQVPIGFDTVLVDKAAILYSSSYGSWGRQHIYLKCNVGTTVARIGLF